MKLTPRSMARWRAARDVVSSVEPQSLPPIAQAPKPMAEIFQPVRPKGRYSIAPPCLLSSANAEFSVAHSGLPRSSGLCTRGKDGCPRPGGVAAGTLGMIGTGDSVEMEHASTARAETGGFGESLAGSFSESGNGGALEAVGTDATVGTGGSGGGVLVEAAGCARQG